MNKENLIARLRGMLKPKHTSFDKRTIHPVREWLIGLTIFLAIVILGGTQSALLFVEYRNITTQNDIYEEPTVRYNRVLVENMLKKFHARKEAYEVVQSDAAEVQSVEITVPTQTEATSTEDVPELDGEVMLEN